ncbi:MULTISPECIES: SprB repeat-containing protein [Niastella]|uniref:SprB repeat-containing protein n=1 Tax=Niastella soli TaxID=2821487 RepID=A0ABS3YZ73_9BACT|nr:SprB repeat-containing protein [Niastella soli]MBO9203038.1 SprB repeat-containing protein [Niastella soli]
MRTRVLLLITVLLLAAVSVTLAQPKYRLRMYTQIGCPYKNYGLTCTGNLYTADAYFINPTVTPVRLSTKDRMLDGKTGYNLMYLLSNCSSNPRKYWDSTTWNVSQTLTKIHLYSSSDDVECHTSCQSNSDWVMGDNYTSNGFFYSKYVEPSDCFSVEAQAWIFPDKITLTASKTYLPSTDRITISATADYPAAVYKWNYDDGTGWKEFPASTNTYGKSTISISGYDLMGPAFDNLSPGTQVRFCVSPVSYFASDIISLTATIPCPHITSVTPFPNKCFGVKDGTLSVQFDRPLYAGETLNIVLNDDLNDQHATAADVTLDASNSYTFPATYGPGNFEIKLLGNYKGVSCYNGDPSHTNTTAFSGPTAVSFSNITRNVYCFSGADGTIVLNASGGVGNYSAGYKQAQDDTYAWTGFGSPSQHTITGLDSGVYQLRIYDGNNCIMKDGAGNEVVQTVTITQPAEPVQVDYRETTNPLAFGRKDGNAMVIIIGGSPLNGNSYNMTWKDSTTGSVLNTVTNSTDPFTTKLQQIGDGTYLVIASDANYALATGVNAAGCMVADTLHLHQPPLLTVAVEERHYVSCKNGADGELYANAQGGIEIPSKRYSYQWYRNVNGSWTSIAQTDSFAVKLTAGTYKVEITDKNNIDVESDPFVLAEPNLLTVALSSTQVICSGGNDGTASAVIAGGTAPYGIAWSNGATTQKITGLTTANYLAFVNDARGCQTQQQVKVTTPNPIVFNNPVTVQPVCAGYCNGAISYTISGGTAPYSYQWSNGSSAQTQTALCAGAYSVKVIDAKGCSEQQVFNLQDPLPLTVALGPDRTLCAGQAWVANAAIADANAVYNWSGANGFKASTASVSLTEPGKYTVQVTDSKGCYGSGSISISRSDATVAADFAGSTQAFKGEKVTFVNISQPWPETTEWLVPADNITVTRRTDTLIELQFSATGTYRIGMRSGVGSCTKEYGSNITIVEGQTFDSPGSATTDPFVLDYALAPNPSNGTFTVTVGLREIADISLRLINLQSGAIIDQQRKSGSDKYTVPYKINVVSGVYALVLETAKDTRILRVLIL